MTLAWLDEATFSIDGVEFVYSFDDVSTAQRFSIRKPRELVDATVRVLGDVPSGRIVELGIASGGSTALLAMVGAPRKLVALELSEPRVQALDELIDARGWDGIVRPYYGVDQADRTRCTAILEREFGAAPLDLVIDDASHRFAPTRASFELLYPRLRPGGLYVIEDWNWQLRLAYGVAMGAPRESSTDGAPDELRRRVAEYARDSWSTPPLERLALELVLARACADDAVRDVCVDEHRVAVRRGSAELDQNTFRLKDLYVAVDGLLG